MMLPDIGGAMEAMLYLIFWLLGLFVGLLLAVIAVNLFAQSYWLFVILPIAGAVVAHIPARQLCKQ